MNYLIDNPVGATATIVLAHGAGAPMDSDFMASLADELAAAGLAVVRFEFPYMAQRRVDGRKRPPNRQPVLLQSFRQVVEDLAARADLPRPLLIGGKSMGGRMATLLAVSEADPVAGVCCFGYPFHPPGKAENMAARIEHLQLVKKPVHIFQGTRDPFGKHAELAGADLGPEVTVHWLEDGDHDLKPRKASGLTQSEHIKAAAGIIASGLFT